MRTATPRRGGKGRGPRKLSLLVPLGCFAYVVARPVSNNILLLSALGLMWLFALGAIVVRAPRLAPTFSIVLLGQLAFAAFGIFEGLAADNPGIFNAIAVYLVAPLLYWVLVWAVDLNIAKSVLQCLAIMSSVLATTIVLYVANQKGIIPEIVPSSILVGSGSGFRDLGTHTELRFYGLSTLAAVGPMWIASLLVPPDDLMPPVWLRSYAATSAMVAVLVGGRQAIVLTMVTAPLILWCCARIIGQGKHPRYVVGALAADAGRRPLRMLAGSLGVLGVVYLVSRLALGVDSVRPVSNTFSAVGSLFSGSSGAGVDTKILVEESGRLLSAWAAAPIGGRGFGAVIDGYRRSVERPWNFELQYHLLLLQTGIVGILAVGVVLFFCIRALRAAAERCPQYSATLAVTTVGAVALLIANFADPYLQAPGHMWAIYLPLAVGNAMLVRGIKGGSARIAPRSTAVASRSSPRILLASSDSGSPTSSSPS